MCQCHPCGGETSSLALSVCLVCSHSHWSKSSVVPGEARAEVSTPIYYLISIYHTVVLSLVMAVDAAALLPSVFAASAGSSQAPEAELAPHDAAVGAGDSTAIYMAKQLVSKTKADDLYYDLGCLTAVDSHPVGDGSAWRKARDGACIKQRERAMADTARENVQLLIGHIFALPITSEDTATVVHLPMPTSMLPRHRPVPAAKPLTKWQAFAKEKGIQKKKKDRKVWDEATGDWRARHGYGRAEADTTLDWARPVKKHEDPYVNPFEMDQLKKQERVVKNQMKRMKNLVRAAPPLLSLARLLACTPRATSAYAPSPQDRAAALSEQRGAVPSGIPADLKLAEGAVNGPVGHGKQGRAKPSGSNVGIKRKRLAVVQASTASIGRFDRQVANEPSRPRAAVRRTRAPVESRAADEATRMERAMRKALAK